MKRFTATWTLAIASAFLLTAPARGAAQTPPQTPQPTSSASQPGAAPDARATAQEDLRKASAALAEIKTAALPAKAKNDIAEIKRRVATLERTTAATDKASATAQANRSANAKTAANWGAEVAAIDKALSGLLGPDSATAVPTGTAGTTPAPTNKAAAAVSLDAEARASLIEVRKHLTAFAAAMTGGKAAADVAPAPVPQASSSTPAPNPAAASTASQSQAAQPPTSQSQIMQQPAQPDPTPAAQAQGDPETARQHLTAGRNTLSALTQLPAAAQLSGEARSQVAQLIANFNELITTQSQWRDSYGKVNANLTALLGPDPVASDPTNAAGTAGAVGTSGTAAATIDPAVREKLVELRRNLTAFEKAATGGTASSAPAATSAVDPANAAAPQSTTTPATKPPAPPPSATQPTQPPATGTTGAKPQGAATSNADVMKHVAAIDALFKMQDDSGGLTLTKTQVEQLRTHWAALRLAIEKK